MKTKSLIFIALALLSSGLCFCEEEISPRKMYKEGFSQMQKAAAYMVYEEGKNRQDHFGFGASGTFLMRFQDWTLSNLNDGFINLELNYCLNPFMYAEIGGGYHATTDRTVIPLFAELQLVFPSIVSLEELPSASGISLGFINYFSNIASETTACFKVGVVSYKFFTKNIALETSIEWITPDFRGNNIVVKMGPKIFWM